MEKNKRYFYISFFVMSVCNIITSCINIFDIDLPDYLFAIYIIVLLASVFAVIYFSIKMWIDKQK